MTAELKVCNKCHLELPLSSFTITNHDKGWRLGSCKPCAAARVRAYYATNAGYREKSKANSVKQAKSNPERHAYRARKAKLKADYNLTLEQFDQLLDAQGGCCALCGAAHHGVTGASSRYNGTKKWLSGSWRVDHDHGDGHVRGLLCHACNTRLGGYEALMDSVGEAKLLDYLTRPSPILALPVVVPPVDVRTTARFVAELPPRYTRGQCSVCGEDQHAGGLCFKHYMRARRNGGDAGPAESLQKGVLTADDVRAIRAAPGEYGVGTKLATQYGVTVSMISKIRKGSARADVTEEVA